MTDDKKDALVLSQKEMRQQAIEKYSGKIPDSCHFYCEACGWDGTLKFDPAELADLGHDPERYVGPCPGKTGETCGFMMLLPYRLMREGHESLFGESDRRNIETLEKNTDIVVSRIVERVVPFLAGARRGDDSSSSAGGAAPAAPSLLEAGDRTEALTAVASKARDACVGVTSSDVATYKNIVIDAAAAVGVPLNAAEVHSMATALMEEQT